MLALTPAHGGNRKPGPLETGALRTLPSTLQEENARRRANALRIFRGHCPPPL